MQDTEYTPERWIAVECEELGQDGAITFEITNETGTSLIAETARWYGETAEEVEKQNRIARVNAFTLAAASDFLAASIENEVQMRAASELLRELGHDDIAVALHARAEQTAKIIREAKGLAA